MANQQITKTEMTIGRQTFEFKVQLSPDQTKQIQTIMGQLIHDKPDSLEVVDREIRSLLGNLAKLSNFNRETGFEVAVGLANGMLKEKAKGSDGWRLGLEIGVCFGAAARLARETDKAKKLHIKAAVALDDYERYLGSDEYKAAVELETNPEKAKRLLGQMHIYIRD
jgi:hypothetical protein